ncbi:alpha/beta hydrolase, partial [Streptomyces violaceoruber]
MRAAALYSAAGSLLLATLTAAPVRAAPPAGPGPAEALGTAVAARRAAAAGVDFGRCPQAEELPDGIRCGTVTVPLDYAHPDGKQVRLT